MSSHEREAQIPEDLKQMAKEALAQFSEPISPDNSVILSKERYAQLAAAEKRATEAEASNAVMKTALEKTKMGFKAFWINYKRQRYPDHQSDCQCKGCSDCRAVLAEADIALQNLPARAQAVAEVLAVLHQTERRDYLYGGSVAINAGWFGDLMRAYNKLAALDKEQ